MPEETNKPADEALSRLERELANVKQGLALLGVQACVRCVKFFRISDPGSLFDAGQMVCFNCIPQWWPERSPELSVADRETVERKLVHWLLNYHQAKAIKRSDEASAAGSQEFRIVACCEECSGTGVFASSRCHFCGGRGTLWVVIPRESGSNG